jgi:hypothetical protein
VSVRFDEPNCALSAGLLPAAVLAQRLGLPELVEQRVRLIRHGAHCGTKGADRDRVDARRPGQHRRRRAAARGRDRLGRGSCRL